MTDTTTAGRPQSLNVFLDPEKYDSLRRQWSDQYIWSPAPVPGDIPLHRTAFISDLDEKEAAEEEAERQKREEEARKKREEEEEEEEARQQQLEEEEARAAAVVDDNAPATQTGDDDESEGVRDPGDEGLPDLADADESSRGGAGHRKRDSAISVTSRSSRSSQGHAPPARSARRHDDGGETLHSPPRRPAPGPTSRPLPLARGEAADIRGPRTTARKTFRRPAPIITSLNPKRLRSFHLPALRGDGDRNAPNNSNNSNNNNTNKDTQITGLPIIASPTVDDTPYTNQPSMASSSGVVASPTRESPSASPEGDVDADTNYTHGSEAAFSTYAPAPGPVIAEKEYHDLQAQTPRGPWANPFTDPGVVATPPSKRVTSPPPPAASQNVMIPEAANVGSSIPPVPPAPAAPVAPAPGIAAASTAPVPEATAKGGSTRRSRAARKGKASSLPGNVPSTSRPKRKKEEEEEEQEKTAPPGRGLAPPVASSGPPGLPRARSAPVPPAAAAHKRNLTLQLDLNIDVEVELRAKIGGDLTLTLF